MEGVYEKHLKGLDESLFSYIRSLIEEAEAYDDELKDQVLQILISADFVDEEMKGEKVVNDLFNELETSRGKPSVPSNLEEGPKLLGKAIVMDQVENKSHSASFGIDKKSSIGVTVTRRNTEFKVSERKLTRKEKREADKSARTEKHVQGGTDSLNYDTQIASLVNSLAELDFDTSEEVLQDIHLHDFDLPSKAGSGSLLLNCSVHFVSGRRYGLVGRNGIGKTTFLEALAQRKIAGMDKKKGGASLLVKQEIHGDSMNPMEWVLNSDIRLKTLKRQAKHLETLGETEKDSTEFSLKLTEIYRRIEALESTYGMTEARAHKILHGLGFSREMQSRPTCSLSGGWRMRVAIACALFVSPPLLLLDEPTNHLDIEAVIWLENYLVNEFKGTVILVSHDRNFLDAVCTDIIHFANQTLSAYRGDFTAYEKTVKELKARKLRWGEWSKSRAKRKSRMKKLERLGMEAAAENQGRKFKASYDGEHEDVKAVEEEKQVKIKFPEPAVFKGVVVTMDNVDFDYNNNLNSPLLHGINFNCEQNARIGLLGRNGSGKSTFLKLLMGRLEPLKGWVTSPPKFRIGYVAQHHVEQLDMNMTALEFLLRKFPGDQSLSHENEMRRYLASFGLGGTRLPQQSIQTLSGGQKVRVVLAATLYVKPNFLVFDEPTNHCSFELTNALIEAIKEFAGGVLIVSHDEYLLKQVCKEYYICKANQVKRYNGTFDDYKRKVLKEQEQRPILQERRMH